MSLYDFCLSGDLGGVRAALKRGDDVNQVYQVWQHGECENPQCKDRPNCDFKAIPIMGAIRGGNADVVRLLLQQPAIDVMRIINGFTPIHWALFIGSDEIAVMLLTSSGSDLDMASALVAGNQMDVQMQKDLLDFVQNCGPSKSTIKQRQRQQKRAEKIQRDQLAEKRRIQKEQEERRKEEQKKKEEDKKKIGLGKGRNARKRKKEEENKRKEKEILESQVGETVPEDVERNDHNFEEAEIGENTKKAANEKAGAHEKKEAADKKAANKTLIEFLEGQILQLEEDLECPVCLDIASTTPIYRCSEDHLICRWAPNSNLFDLHHLAGFVVQKFPSAPNAEKTLGPTIRSSGWQRGRPRG